MKSFHPLASVLGEIGHTYLLFFVFLTATLRTGRDLACIITIANVADIAIQGGDLFRALVWVIIAEFIGIPILALDSYCCEKYRAVSERALAMKISEKIQSVSLAWLDSHSVGDLISTSTADVDKVLQWQFRIVPNCIRTLTYLAGGLWYCCTQSFLLTACVFPVILFVVPLINKISEPLKKNANRQRHEAAKSLSKIQEVLADPEFVKSYSLEKQMDQRIRASLEARKAAEDKAALIWARSKSIGKLGSYLPSLFSAAAGVLFLSYGTISIGFLFSFVQMVSQRFGFVIPQLSDIFSSSHQAGASAERIMELLGAPPEKTGDPVYAADKSPAPEIVFSLEGVCFAYPSDPATPVLKNITMEIRKGEHIALVGSSGCGKSTLLKLLMGICQPDSGDFRYRGRRMQEVDVRRLRAEIAPVLQASFLFPLSIRDNLHVFESPCSETKLLSALEDAGMGDYVRSQPQGLDTVLDQQGSSLSGGQRQRLAIARAFLKDAPIVILDEPTSAMDTVTQASFQEAFERIAAGKTTIMVSHRWPVIEGADRIYVMEHGRIVECGTHRELMELGGVYKKLHQVQGTESMV